MAEKDHPAVQQKRIRQIAEELVPGCSVGFDPNEPPSMLHFRIDAPITGAILGFSRYHLASEVADWTDEKLRGYIQAIAQSFAGNKS